MTVSIIGLGACESTLTAEAAQALRMADRVVGAGRLLQSLPAGCRAEKIEAVRAAGVLAAVLAPGAGQVCAVFSGDTGFYSGAAALVPTLRERGITPQVYPGLSSVQLLAAALGTPWQGWLLASAHGRECDPVQLVMGEKPVFFLTGGEKSAAALCARLTEAGLGELPVTAGENLGLPGQKVHTAPAREMAEASISPLCVLLVQPAVCPDAYGTAIPDDAFIRGSVPMTKQLVRAAILAELRLAHGSVCWDVGAGTGSVSVALSRAAQRVYAVECEPEGCELIGANRQKFGAWNLTVVPGRAPEALQGLPAPDCVFIGGSKGSMQSILEAALAANPAVRVCASAIALETLHAACSAMQAAGMQPAVSQIAVSSARPAGSLHLMMAQNPVWLITGQRP